LLVALAVAVPGLDLCRLTLSDLAIRSAARSAGSVQVAEQLTVLGIGLLPFQPPRNPKLVLPPGAIVAFQATFPAVTTVFGRPYGSPW
jgi:hypothetical protein